MSRHDKHYKVAVITRTRDRRVLLERAIQSVHHQTMRDFVHVIINDGGDPAIVDELVRRYALLIKGRVRVVHIKTSHGMEAASNQAIQSVDSEFIAIHDDDDSWHPDFLHQTTTFLDDNKAMGVVVTTDRIEERIDGDTITTISQSRWLPGLEAISLYDQCRDNYATPITFLYRRSVFPVVGYYDETLPVCGDWDFAIRFLLHFDIAFLPTEAALAYYHHRPHTAGPDGNTVFVASSLHRHYRNVLRNRYLRADIAAGRVGAGFIMNMHAGYQEMRADAESMLQHYVVRLEGHMNYCTRQVEARIDSRPVERRRSTVARAKALLRRMAFGQPRRPN